MLGKKIELVIEDNKCNPTEAAAVAEKLIVRDKVPVLMGAWGSSLTLAVMPKLMEYEVPMLVETSSSGKITTTGNPFIFRISPPSAIEATAFAKMIDQLDLKKADFLVINNDWGRGTAEEFGKMFKAHGIKVGPGRDHGPGRAGHERAARQDQGLRRRHPDRHHRGRAADADLQAGGGARAKRRIITTGGSQAPDQLIEQAGGAANGSIHWCSSRPGSPTRRRTRTRPKNFIAEWKKRGYAFAGCTESFRGYDGIRTIAAAIKKAGKAEPAAIQAALWNVKSRASAATSSSTRGPAGKESGQSVPNVYLVERSKRQGRHEDALTSRNRARAVADRALGRLSDHLDQFLQHLVNALVLGGTYALLGIGLTLIFGIMRVVNFTHGELYAFGAYMMYIVVISSGSTSSSRCRSPSRGLAARRGRRVVLLRPLRGADIDTTMLVMIGAWIVMQNGELLVWGGVAKSIADAVPRGAAGARPGVGVLAAPVRARRRAAADRRHLSPDQPHEARHGHARDLPGRDTAALMGVNIDAIHTATFALGSGLAAAAGALLGPVFVVDPTMGDLAVAQGVRDRHPRRPRQHHRRDDRRLHPRARRGDGRRLRLVRLPRRDGLPAHHRRS